MSAPPEPRGGEGLEPCPFDGEPAVARDAMGEHWIACGSCNASTNSKGKRTLAIDLWNRRPPSPPSGGGGWPSREEVAEAIGGSPDIRSMTDRVLALFPPVVGWRPIEDVLDAASAYITAQYGISALSHPIDRARVIAALPAAPDHIGEADEMVRDQTDGVGE